MGLGCIATVIAEQAGGALKTVTLKLAYENLICTSEAFNNESLALDKYRHIKITATKLWKDGTYTRKSPHNQIDAVADSTLGEISMGPAPPRNATISITDCFEKELSDAELQYIPVDSILSFKAYDSFHYPLYEEENKKDNQCYGCATYDWELKKDGVTVSKRLESGGTWMADALEEGEYELALVIWNNARGSIDVVQKEFKVTPCYPRYGFGPDVLWHCDEPITSYPHTTDDIHHETWCYGDGDAIVLQTNETNNTKLSFSWSSYDRDYDDRTFAMYGDAIPTFFCIAYGILHVMSCREGDGEYVPRSYEYIAQKLGLSSLPNYPSRCTEID